MRQLEDRAIQGNHITLHARLNAKARLPDEHGETLKRLSRLIFQIQKQSSEDARIISTELHAVITLTGHCLEQLWLDCG